ncbi:MULTISPECIES: hypothetical protein [unclassified Curtobacterium]|uniref:hypothetical protein n=1 Tax=unclassified Curtobacterium TaxID=257496 RepID=UPI000DAAABDB|nr:MULTISPECIES: hypothetical protein [unclassified Curtobacterium]WIB63313.1 hypothetical protein DEI94_14370 [Curtobacterium sp. MCBD17_040]WIB67151.1 hypothetical protein DEI93_14520 [Curtobacterium sp. MCBD17_035]
MTGSGRPDLEAELATLVGAVPGVEQVYRRGVVRAAAAGARRLVGAGATDAPVEVGRDGVTMTIAVDGIRPTVEVVHAVHDAVMEHLTHVGLAVPVIVVRVGRIG